MADRKLLAPEVGQGADLHQIVMDALEIPPTSRWFEVRFAVGEPITVTCEYHPTEQPVLPHIPEDDDGGAPRAPNYGGLNG